MNQLKSSIIGIWTAIALASSSLTLANEVKTETQKALAPQVINPQEIDVPDHVWSANRHIYRCYTNEKAKSILTWTLKGCSIILWPVSQAVGSDWEKFE